MVKKALRKRQFSVIVSLVGLVLFTSLGLPLRTQAEEQDAAITSRGFSLITNSAFLALGGIKGRATIPGFENQIVIQRPSVALHNPRDQDVSHAGGGSITFVKGQDLSNSYLIKAFRSRRCFPVATLMGATQQAHCLSKSHPREGYCDECQRRSFLRRGSSYRDHQADF